MQYVPPPVKLASKVWIPTSVRFFTRDILTVKGSHPKEILADLQRLNNIMNLIDEIIHALLYCIYIVYNIVYI